MENLVRWYYRKKAKWSLLLKYRYMVEVHTLLEEHQTEKILQGGSEKAIAKGRQYLAEKQAEIRETQALVDFLKNVK